MQNFDVIVIGSGIGGLVAGALLAHSGKQVMILESHTLPGGAAQGFSRQGFHFDSGPSFYCGLSNSQGLNPLQQVLTRLGESLTTVVYDPLGHYHFPEGSLAVYGNRERYRKAIAQFTPEGVLEFAQFEHRLLKVYQGLKEIPAIELRADWKVIPKLITNYGFSLLKLLPVLGDISSSVGEIVEQTVHDPWVRRLIDLECFLLSGLKAEGTMTPEVAFMIGERNYSTIEYPIGGSQAIVQALVRGLTRFGGKIQLGTHVEKILVNGGKVYGVKTRKGEEFQAPTVISNATIWDTYTHLLNSSDLPPDYRKTALNTPAVDSFMHLHLGLKSEGLEELTGHHVVVHNSNLDITVPGNTCMISIPSVWDKNLAPPGHHLIHAYTLEPFFGWKKDGFYAQNKQEKAEHLYRAVEKIIPDVRQRTTLELIGTPLTHARYLRRYQGTYGPAIVAGQGKFPGPFTPIQGLYLVGDSTQPGIGVPAVAASGILCANCL
ncbi:phytoene desaturase family protein [Planktothrix pseudagardhii]|uniref:Prolycopene isomerase 2, chloroplastic n=1 Tax=Planktothrix pseudagardhii TaxID=132604 RepID=A0A9W4CHT9_9CYAN|nr:NAD(P)/FAD-dependent oxidoreductase [Planktothrix pseudagardhii]CAD5934930.1 Prolycopene isomerase 2, chloroplastic [Planktothrix pseudagardhii]